MGENRGQEGAVHETAVKDTPPHAQPGRSGPIPIWQSRLYQQRRAEQVASKIRQERMKRFHDGTLLREKRALANYLFELCGKAESVLRHRGGDIDDDLERIADLHFIVDTMDAERPGLQAERLEELRDCLEAVVLAIQVARVAATPPLGSEQRIDGREPAAS